MNTLKIPRNMNPVTFLLPWLWQKGHAFGKLL